MNTDTNTIIRGIIATRTHVSKRTRTLVNVSTTCNKTLETSRNAQTLNLEVQRGQTIVSKRENGDEGIKPLKLGLLGSSETHRGTRWPTRIPMAVHERSRGNLYPEIHRGTLRGSWTLSAVRDAAQSTKSYKTKKIIVTLLLFIILPEHASHHSVDLLHFHQKTHLEAIIKHLGAQGLEFEASHPKLKLEDNHHHFIATRNGCPEA
ncbi:hypothetical protein E3N88_09139 [Mikania micrantha]|uniref:Uncharacterized protein n=1 Tax=Mikania micrantha TaxID=192012 RepID=A0A5N6PKH4_9ASTR|nr:hypothetical protein E3N88_09139 [Mikania micrantha]